MNVARDAKDRRLLVIGAGGHAKVVIDVARAAGWQPHVALDPGPAQVCAGVEVVGTDERAAEFFAEGLRHAVVAIGRNDLRLRIGRRLQDIGYVCPPLIHPCAVISDYATIAKGIVVMPQAVINSHAAIGAFAIINTGAIVEHDCIIGEGAHIAPRSAIGGNVRIGVAAFLGLGASVRPGSVIGDGAVVGVGAVVIGDVAHSAIVFGAPARPRSERERPS
jgi:UDP-perosamine 4-acetyltransferase